MLAIILSWYRISRILDLLILSIQKFQKEKLSVSEKVEMGQVI